MKTMIRTVPIIFLLAFLTCLNANALASTPEPQGEEEGCDVTAKSCAQDDSILDLTKGAMPREQKEESGDFLPGEWNPSFLSPGKLGNDPLRQDERDNVNEGSLRGGGIDPAFPGGGGSTPSSLGTVDSFRH